MTRPAFLCAIAAVVSMIAVQAEAATPRELLVNAAFQTTSKDTALSLVTAARDNAARTLATNPRDREAQLQHALAIGYHARLTKKPGDAKTSRKLIEALVASHPRDAEVQLAMGGWHLDAIAAGFLAATFLGAKRDAGIEGLDKAVSYGGNRAFFPAMAAMMRIRLDSDDVAAARTLAERAAVASAPTPLDQIGRRAAQAMLVPLRAGDGRAAADLAKKLLPFGRID